MIQENVESTVARTNMGATANSAATTARTAATNKNINETDNSNKKLGKRKAAVVVELSDDSEPDYKEGRTLRESSLPSTPSTSLRHYCRVILELFLLVKGITLLFDESEVRGFGTFG